MNDYNSIKTDYEIFEDPRSGEGLKRHVSLSYVSRRQASAYFETTIYLKSSLFVLVLSGSVLLDINFREYEVKQNGLILLSFGHFFRFKKMTANFRCIVLYIGKDYVEEMFSSEMLYKRVKYGVQMHRTPLLALEPSEADLLKSRLDFLKESVSNAGHKRYRELILYSLHIFFVDLSVVIEEKEGSASTQQLSRDELYFHKFLELLVTHYQSQHNVEFYANQIHITAHHLTVIVKRVSGQTVSDLIFELLYSDAKAMLRQPGLSIQQISGILHFSDQSAFGKFFKRNSGMSPREFRRASSTPR